ncbi:hypothetical protein EJ07DRAFT_151493 [Lizonia empirigonia]|nr:hypothetical protein EJ07DRAFT_151493 [Lizonia empirigonia]
MAGKEYTIVVLSSSPPATDAFNPPRYAVPTRRVAMPPSSPFALSPPSSPRNLVSGALASGSRAIPIPETATRGFATVGSLVRSEHFAHQLDDNIEDVQQVQSRKGSLQSTGDGITAAKKPNKRATKRATVVDEEKPKPKPRGRKSKANKETDNETVPSGPKPRKPRPRTNTSPFFENAQTILEAPIEPVADAPKLTKSGKPRKPRAKKEDVAIGDTEAKPKKTKVTKPKAAAKTGKAKREAADVMSAHFFVNKDQVSNVFGEPGAAVDANNQDDSIWDVPPSPGLSRKAPPKKRAQDLPAEGLDIEEAVLRRRDWTPPRDTVAPSPSTVSTGKENRPSTHEATAGTFTHLVSNFAYESPTAKITAIAAKPAAASGASGVTKRRRVELVELPGVQTTSRATSPEKGKAPKKKPRTITDLVTGQYAPKYADADVQDTTSGFFSPRTSTTKVPLNDVADADVSRKKPTRQRSKSKDNPESATTNAKPRARRASRKPPAKPKPVAEKLLSPTSAVIRMSRQEILFGTSSQLAMDESPTTVRQIQRALTESEQDTRGRSQYLLRVSERWPRLQGIEGRRGLWRESTRDSDGGLLENIGNIYIPEPDRTEDLPSLMDITQDEPSLPSEFVDIDDIKPAAPITISSDLSTPPRPMLQTHVEDLDLPRQAPKSDVFDDIDDFESGLPPSNQNAESQNIFADIDGFQPLTETASLPPPFLEARPSASAQVANTGLLKERRGRPPKAKTAIPTVTASAPSPLRKVRSPQQRSRRPLSTPPEGSCRFIDIEEILDSEDEALEMFSPTPPRVRKLQDSLPLPLAFDLEPSASHMLEAGDAEITPISRILTSQLEWAIIRPSICAAINAHIRSIPPTTNPKKPTWHEKILMYDPIILEDFTAYLNSNTKLRTYKRATQKQMKAYNKELKMKGNAILGVERDDQVLAVEKELEVYMVRDWCQEMSICCIHAKESRGRGSARKGFY